VPPSSDRVILGRRSISGVAARAEEAVRAEYMTRRAPWLGFGALAAFVVVGLLSRLPHDPALDAVAVVVSLGAGVLLARADTWAVLVWAALAAAGVAALGSGSGSGSSNVGWFAVCLLAGWSVLAGGRWVGVGFWVVALLLFGVEALNDHDPGWAAWAVGTTFSAGAALVVQQQRSLLEQLRAAQAGLAERSRAEERNRIARELHDVIAHSLTVSLLHVSSARLAVEYDPADAARALDEAERLGRQSLNEVRSIMGMSRSSTGEATAAPVPQIDAVAELVEQFRRAGADISLSVEGDLERVPATTGATAYRIAQESLTNAAKHASGSPVTVLLVAEPRLVELTVDSAGAPGAGAGMGLTSMRERALAVGGSCAAGPHDDGWRVHATLPVQTPAEPAAT
jgi:signal transduction histidine kinase